MTNFLQRVLFWWMFSKTERDVFADVIAGVANDAGIPIYGKDQHRHGREARRDVATERLQERLPHLRDSDIHLGLELCVALIA